MVLVVVATVPSTLSSESNIGAAELVYPRPLLQKDSVSVIWTGILRAIDRAIDGVPTSRSDHRNPGAQLTLLNRSRAAASPIR